MASPSDASPSGCLLHSRASDARLDGRIKLRFHANRADIRNVSCQQRGIVRGIFGGSAFGHVRKFPNLGVGLAVRAQQDENQMHDGDGVHG